MHAEPDLMMRTIFITIYAAGLRISEVVRLTTADLNSERMVIHVRQAKGAHFLVARRTSGVRSAVDCHRAR